MTCLNAETAESQPVKPGERWGTQVVEEGFVGVTGGKIWYRRLGLEEKGVPLLILHGGPGFPSDYLKPLEAFAKKRPVIFYDQIGCGRSDLTSDTNLWTLKRYAIELDQVRKALRLERVHLFGHSWGSMLGFEYYLSHPDSGVVSLISSGSFHSVPRWEADQTILVKNLPAEIQEIITRHQGDGTTASAEYKFAEKIYYNRHIYRSGVWPSFIGRANAGAGEPYMYMWGPSEFFCTGTLKGYDQTPRFKDVKVPTLFTAGEFDECRPDTARWYAGMIAGSEVKVFPGTAHHHFAEAAASFVETVDAFLSRAEIVSKRAMQK